MNPNDTDTLPPLSMLPAPRLQLRWTKSDAKPEYAWECHYELVLPLGAHDIRRELFADDGEVVGTTSEQVSPLKPPSLRGGTSVPCQAQDGSRYYDPPYRDGAHAKWDAAALGGLPILVIAPDGAVFKPPSDGPRAALAAQAAPSEAPEPQVWRIKSKYGTVFTESRLEAAEAVLESDDMDVMVRAFYAASDEAQPAAPDAVRESLRLRAQLDRALTVCRCAGRLIDSSAWAGVSDEDCDLESSVRNWQAGELKAKESAKC